MILQTLALCTLLHFGDPVRDAAEVRSYPLQPLLVPYRPGFQAQILPLRGGPAQEEQHESLDPNLVIETLRALCAPEFEYEGRSLQELEGTLYVSAPAALQEKVARILAFLGGALAVRTELVIDELLLAEQQAKDPAPLLSPDEAQKLVALGGVHRSWRLAIRPGWAASAQSLRAIGFLSDWNVEIAQGAAIHDPVVDQVPAGDLFVGSGAAAPGGFWLALLARGGESAGPKDHPLDFFVTVASETTPIPNAPTGSPAARSSGRMLQAGPRLWQSVPVSLSALALNTFLPDGKVLCLSTTLGVGEHPGTRLVLVRRSNPSVAPLQGFALDPKGSGGRDLVLADSGWLRPPFCDSEGDLRGGGALPMNLENDLGPLRFGLHGADSGRVREMLQDLQGCDVFDSQAWMVLVRSQRTPEGNGLENAVARLGASATLPQVFGAELALRRGQTLLARSTLALRSGVASTVIAGAEDELLADWDVEVAQSAAAADPQIRSSFEGLCAQLRIERDAAGGLVLDLRGFGQAKSGELRNLDPQVPTIGPISEAIWDRLDVQERVTLPADGPKRAAFGDTGGSGMVLEVTLSEPK